MKFGSVCSGIEAASLGFKPYGMEPLWFSETSDFPSRILKHHYPKIPNYGDMNELPNIIKSGEAEAPDVLCGGTPCQAFSLAGWKQGLLDTRGQLTLKFIEVADAIDDIRLKSNKPRAIVMWENVEGVLRDKTNAFGLFLSGLAGLDEEIVVKKWSNSGVLFGQTRNIAWRILDAKFFGLPQQRKRLFLIATDTSINPEKILFDRFSGDHKKLLLLNSLYKKQKTDNGSLFSFSSDETKKNDTHIKYIDNVKIEVFRKYTDCLYSAYGTKWNGNAAAYNGSLYISENDNVRRMTPLECERLMGFPDNYTLISGAKDTSRYQAVGNSWAIPVVEWLGERISNHTKFLDDANWIQNIQPTVETNTYKLYTINDAFLQIGLSNYINTSVAKYEFHEGNIFNLIETNVEDKFYISPKASAGILRRKNERNLQMNNSLEFLFKQNLDK